MTMKKFLDKLKNNKGSAESAMFVFGVAIFATIVVFSMDMLGLTWQRYLATRELSNMSRLYAIRSTDLYYNGSSANIINPSSSNFGAEMGDMLEILVDHGKLTRATLTIEKEGGIQIFKIVANKSTEAVVSGSGWDTFKQIGYGDTLYAKLKVEYRDSGITGVARAEGKNQSYTLTNKFAFEGYLSTNDNIG